MSVGSVRNNIGTTSDPQHTDTEDHCRAAALAIVTQILVPLSG
jgi:hypothetical protein